MSAAMKRQRSLWIIVALLVAVPVSAAFYDFEQITVDSTATGVKLTAAKLTAGLVSVQCRVRTAEISFLMVDPTKTTLTASVGILAEVGDVIAPPTVEMAKNLRMIRTTATSGQVDCQYAYNQQP
jgi:hypothetical protein